MTTRLAGAANAQIVHVRLAVPAIERSAAGQCKSAVDHAVGMFRRDVCRHRGVGATDHASLRGPGRCPAASAHPAGARRPFPAQGIRGWR